MQVLFLIQIYTMKRILFVAFVFASQLVFAQANIEPHLKNIQQLTYGGDNAEAYFSFNGKNLSFQSNNANWGLKCDQIFNMNLRLKIPAICLQWSLLAKAEQPVLFLCQTTEKFYMLLRI